MCFLERTALNALTFLSCLGIASQPTLAFAGDVDNSAVIEYTGSGIGFCGLREDPICKARVLLVDGQKTDYISSDVNVSPGKHTLRLSCTVKFGAFQSMKLYFTDKAVTLRANGKYHVQGTIEGDRCIVDLIDESTNVAVTPEVMEIKASVPGTYPNSEPLALYCSSDTVSGWTEIPAEDHLIPNSQVYVSGGSGKGSSVGGLLGGAAGSVIGIQIDRANNAEKVAAIEEQLQITFVKPLCEALRTAIALRAKPTRYSLASDSADAHLALLPSARLAAANDAPAALSFRLTARIFDREHDKVITKNFFYSIGKKLPLEGSSSWSEDGAKAIIESASIAMPRLANALLDDIEGVSITVDPQNPKGDFVYRAN